MSEIATAPESKPNPRRSRLFLAILLVLLVGGGGALYMVYKQIWDADRPTDPLPGRATGLSKPDPADLAAASSASSKATDTVVEFFNGLKTSLAYARDGMRSRFAVETLKSLAGQVDGLKDMVDKLPTEEKAKAIALVREQLVLVKSEAETTLAARGVGGQLKPIVEPMIVKLEALAK